MAEDRQLIQDHAKAHVDEGRHVDLSLPPDKLAAQYAALEERARVVPDAPLILDASGEAVSSAILRRRAKPRATFACDDCRHSMALHDPCTSAGCKCQRYEPAEERSRAATITDALARGGKAPSLHAIAEVIRTLP